MEPHKNHYTVDTIKLRLKDAVIYYQALLAQNNLISSESSASISHEAMLMGEEIFQNTLAILAEKIIVSDEELIHENERCQESYFLHKNN
ncbi:hypothetical protein AVEN_132203-1 [Araneus ventricosus]|uniref:Uncharacterized protein n=1 Tax=Araneus ventricosus TaxID=182803 RepID=A0A4Y2IJE3_ARAVE|nr:hypothetical protein AVEN_132203-1 [Araneus ventricosus]